MSSVAAGVRSGRTRDRLPGGMLLACLILACPLSGQSSPPPGSERPAGDTAGIEEELVRRIETLVPRQRAAATRARESRRVRDSVAAASRPPLETVEIEVGPLRIVTLPGQEETARRLFEEELAALGPLGVSAAHLLGEDPIAFQWGLRLEALDPEGSSESVALRRIWGASSVRRRIRLVLGARLVAGMPPPVHQWLGGRPVGALADASPLRRGLILDGSASVRGCARGDVDACWASFGLSGSERPITEWYTPRQVLVLAPSRHMESWVECAENDGVSVERCYEDFLGSSRSWNAAIPFNQAFRVDLVEFALDLGGPGALQRFLADWPEGVDEPGTGSGTRASRTGLTLPELGKEMRSHLVAAAGVSEDELMRRWRERILAAAPEERHGLGRARMATGFWVLFFAVLATRSTRWRLG